MQALRAVPSVIFAACACAGLKVDFFVIFLAYIGNPEVASGSIETESPRITQAVGPDFGLGSGAIHEWIGWRNLYAAGLGLHIDTQHLAEQRAEVLAITHRVAAGASIPHADIQVTIGPEFYLAAVVVFKWLGNVEQHGFGSGVGSVRIRGDAIEGDDGIALKVCVIDVETLVLREFRWERKAKQPALAGACGLRSYIEERLREESAIAENAHDAVLLDQKQAAGSVGGVLNVGRIGNTGYNLPGAKFLCAQWTLQD